MTTEIATVKVTGIEREPGHHPIHGWYWNRTATGYRCCPDHVPSDVFDRLAGFSREHKKTDKWYFGPSGHWQYRTDDTKYYPTRDAAIEALRSAVAG